ncbi:MAG: polysaccharide biosynthesis protein [Synergistaceae bacterium]|nr:polysaccharide biosynthesis protein [Synergistaceae bacterium]
MKEKILYCWLKCAARGRRVALLDFCLMGMAVYLGFALRLTMLVTPQFRDDLVLTAAVWPACVVVAMWLMRIYRVYWPQASVEEYTRMTTAYMLGCALFICVNFFSAAIVVPRTSLAITLFGGLIFTGAVRASWRLAEFYASSGGTAVRARNTIIIGAGEAGAYLARDLQRRGSAFNLVGFIDSDPEKKGKIIAGVPVLGDDEEITRFFREYEARVALIAIPSAGGGRIRKYLDAVSSLNVEVRVLPSLRELAGGGIELGSLRSVELQDLLRREPIRLDEAEISMVISGKRILVTGAGGSIGSEICVQLAGHRPAELLALGHGEHSIYNLLQHLNDIGCAVPCRPIIADIADGTAMERVFAEYRPEIVFHAGAHKHVPLMEENPREALRVNALGTWIVADMAGAHGVERVIMISTDKAVHPSSVMGATKRIAERLLRGAQDERPGTRYIAVRFGNVLGSRGSVVPLFERQIMRGGPVTVTHPDMRRYFMLIPEAVNLVLQAASMGRGGELYVLDMGEPVNIAEMAETLIRLHGREPHVDVKIEYTGLRKGEKLFEELFYDPLHVDSTSHEKIFLSKLDEENSHLTDGVKSMLELSTSADDLRTGIFALARGSRKRGEN